MNVRETFSGDDAEANAIDRLESLVGTTEPIKKIDMRSYQGGYKLIFRTQEPKSEEK